MSPYEYYISLRFRNSDFDPQQIGDELGIPAFRTWRVGDTYKANGLDRTRQHSYWCSKDLELEQADIDKDLLKLAGELEMHRTFLRSFVESGGTIELYIAIYGEGNIGLTLSWNSLEKLSDFRINVAWDIYDTP